MKTMQDIKGRQHSRAFTATKLDVDGISWVAADKAIFSPVTGRVYAGHWSVSHQLEVEVC